MIFLLCCVLYISTVTYATHYDYIVVGSGSAGSVVANRLSEDPTIKVLLLEAGGEPNLMYEVPLYSDNLRVSPISWNYTTVPLKYSGYGLVDRETIVPRGKVLGGTASIYGNLYTRGNKYDFNRWASEGALGWDWESVFPYFIELEDNGDPAIVANGFHGVGGPQPINHSPFLSPITAAYLKAAEYMGYQVGDFNGPNETIFMPPQGTILRGRRWAALKSFIQPIRGRRNIRILTNAFVTKILIDDKRRAYGVLFDRYNKQYQAFAKEEVILCAGVFNTAKLLMLSGIGPRRQLEKLHIPVVSDLPVGKNLQDHPTCLLQIFHTNTFTYREGNLKKEDYDQFLSYGIGPLTSLVAIEAVGYIKTDEHLPFPELEIIWRTVNPGQNEKFYRTNFNARRELWEAVAPYAEKDIIGCYPFVSVPKSRGQMGLASANPYDPPLIDPNFYAHPHDVKVMVEGMKFCLEMANQEPMRRKGVKAIPLRVPGCEEYKVFSDEYLACAARVAVVSLDHYVGTCKMGDPRDPTTVVDPLLRVKGIHSLRVIDASVMPTITSGHTHAPTAMIGAKGADIVLHYLAYKRKLHK